MKNRFTGNLFQSICMLLTIFLLVGCSKQRETPTTLLPFSITNKFAGGELRQVIQITNGMSLYFTDSNIVMGFCPGSDTVINFDTKTHKPLTILLEIPPSGGQPGQSILDYNADGIPDIREIKDASETHQIFFHGDWYTKTKEGGFTIIIVDGKKRKVHFNGERWIDVITNNDSLATNKVFIGYF